MHHEHRERFLEQLAAREAAALVFTGSPPLRNGDSEYPFRPSSDFVYLTGFREPDAALLLLPHGERRSVLFLREKDPDQEVWTGRRLGVEAAPEALGIDAAYPIEALWEELPELLGGHDRLVFAAERDEARERALHELLDDLRSRRRRGQRVPATWEPPDPTLHELRLVKDARELECMRRAAAISVEAHRRAMVEAAPGRHEYEIEAALAHTFRSHGSTGPAYTSIVAGGANACILHYVENDAQLRDGDLLLIDAGAEWDYYASDVTRTFPVNGRFSPEQRALYDLVLAALEAATASVRPGTTMAEVHEAALGVLVDGLLEHGLLSGSRAEVLAAGSYRRFFMHKTGHWLGLDVHDCGDYFANGSSRPLVPGMVTTVEPGLYVAPDDDEVEERWRGIGIRIEDDVLVTEDGHEVLSAGAPKAADEVEALCGADAP